MVCVLAHVDLGDIFRLVGHHSATPPSLRVQVQHLQDGHPLLPQLETRIQDSEQQCAFTEQEDCRCASTFRGCLRPSPVYQFLILVKSGAFSLKIQSLDLF